MIKNDRGKIFVRRNLEDKIEKLIDASEIIATLGARQVGKITLMRKIFGKIVGRKIFLDFEDPEADGLFDEDIKAFSKLYIENYEFIFIDEFQHSQIGGKGLKYIYDTFKKKIFISGASSLELTVKLSSTLVGRIFILELYPLSFEEIILFRTPKIYRMAISYLKKQKEIPAYLHKQLLRELDEFFVYVGFPRVVIEKTLDLRKEILESLFITYLIKDIKGFFRLSYEYSFQKLIKLLSLQVRSLINYSKLSRTANVGINVKRNISTLEETCLIRLARPYFTNKRTEVVKNPKIYLIDNGLRNYIIQDFREPITRADMGQIVENFVASEIVKSGKELKFWRSKSKAEVDFVRVSPRYPILVEEKSRVAKSPGKSLISFIRKYRVRKVFVLHRGNYSKRTINGTEILFVSFYAVNLIFKEQIL